jgi:hypothetical protein
VFFPELTKQLAEIKILYDGSKKAMNIDDQCETKPLHNSISPLSDIEELD